MSRLSSDFWTAQPIKPAPMLAALREMVLERSEKRSPKWKFRLSPDLVLQIQPKLTTALLKFECRALRCEGADLSALLAKRGDIKRPYWGLSFDLRADAPGIWFFKARYVSWWKSGEYDGLTLLRNDCIDAFEADRFDVLRPDMMLGSHCLICGKGLTDPVSQARHIGPECAGTSSAQLPFVLRLADRAA